MVGTTLIVHQPNGGGLVQHMYGWAHSYAEYNKLGHNKLKPNSNGLFQHAPIVLHHYNRIRPREQDFMKAQRTSSISGCYTIISIEGREGMMLTEKGMTT